MAKKVIIGIHGLGNKPPRKLLQRWWRQAIREGLKKTGYDDGFDFELIYWAHFFNSEPKDLNITEESHPLYIEHPYVPAEKIPAAKAEKWRQRYLNILESILDRFFLSTNSLVNFDRLSDWLIRKKFRDLELYYDPRNSETLEIGLKAKNRIRQELTKVLKRNRRKDILLIAHSMGSIIAYDVLTQNVPDIKVNTFITIGSPLGLPAVMKKIFLEQDVDFSKDKRVATPDNIRKNWFNFADLHDTIAMNYTLSDDYKPNRRGIGPRDTIIVNDYVYKGERDHHNIYGYLRAKAVSQVIKAFLTSKRFSVLDSIRSWFRTLLGGEEQSDSENA